VFGAGVTLGGGGPLVNPAARVRLFGEEGQHGRSLLWLMLAPRICSRVIFVTSASKSPRERSLQTCFSRRARSFRTQSSLLSRLSESRSPDFDTAALRARTNLSVIDISPQLAAEASRERRGRRYRRLRLCCLDKWDV
jgi:hypothetical protein